MGWVSTYVGKTRMSKKDLVIDEVFKPYGIENLIVYIEQKGNNVWVVEKGNNNELFAELYLTSYKDGEFAYKNITIDMCPYQTNCSKKFYEMCKEIYTEDVGYARQWLDMWEENQIIENNRKNKIKSLKIGDIIKFKTANYGDKEKWQVSYINGAKILFEGYNLKGWRKQEFEIVERG